MSHLVLSLLGSPCVEKDGTIIHIETRKALALLIYLAITADVVSRDTLTALLWPESPTAQAKASLRSALSTLKKAIGHTYLHSDRQAVHLNWAAGIQLDVADFKTLTTTAGTDHAALLQAVTLYRNDFLTGFSLPDSPVFDEWQFFEGESLRQTLAQTLERVITHYQAAQAYATALPYARQWLALDPLHEPAHYHLIYLYAHAGQRAAALRQYEECKWLLQTELGLEPSPQTAALYQHLRRRTLDKAPTPAFTTPNPEEAAPAPALSPLPTPTTSFIGREQEIADLTAQLAHPTRRLITIVGPGGIGKTRTALQTAHQQTSHFAHGICYIDLTPLSSPHFFVPAIIDALSFSLQGQEPPLQQLCHYLQEREMLLLLDNCEHLLKETAVISTILAAAPRVKVLVTSREPLAIQEEWLYPLSGLSVPPTNTTPTAAAYSSVQLFRQRARQIDPHFSLAAAETAVIHICRLLEGMPLAIELAAAWVRLMPCAHIAQEIGRNLDFLTSTRRDSSPRHHSIRAVFEHSWRLLSPREQQLLAQLSIFRGGFSRQAALAVTETSLFTLYGLVNKSLVRLEENGRYTLHELLRQFASEKQAHLSAHAPHLLPLPQRHATYYATFLQEKEKDLFGAQQNEKLNAVKQEIENIRLAWKWMLNQADLSAVGRCLHTLYCFYSIHSRFQEGLAAFSQAVAVFHRHLDHLSPTEQHILARLMARQGEFAYILGQLARAERILSQSLALCQQLEAQEELALCYQLLGITTYLQGKYQEAEELLTQGLHLAAECDNQHRHALILLSLGAVKQAVGQYQKAQHYHQLCLNIYEQLDYQWGVAQALRFLGIAAYRLGRYEQAQAYLEESLTICQCIDNQSGIALAANYLGMIAQAAGNYHKAQHLYQQGLTFSQASNIHLTQSLSWQNLGRIMTELGDYQQADNYLHTALQTAMTTQATPLTLEIMLDIVAGLSHKTETRQAYQLIHLIRQHPASNWETQHKAAQFQHQLLAQLPSHLVAHIQETSKTITIEEAALELMTAKN